MKAFVIKRYGTIGDIEQVEIDGPTVGMDEVLVRVKSASINQADINVITGTNGARFIHSAKSPIRLGFDFSGVIEEMGGKVSQFKTGNDVFGFLPYSSKTTQGSFADFVAVKSSTIARKPSSISHAHASTVGTTASTALQALVKIAGITSGQKVLVNGASGGVGTYALQMAKSYHAEVWGSCSESNSEYVKSMGADHCLDYKKTNIYDLNQKFDIVFDVVSNSSFGKCSGILASKGVFITLLPTVDFVNGKIQSLFSSKRCTFFGVKPTTVDLIKIARMIDDEVISTPVTLTYPIAELQKALEKITLGGVQGKIGIVIED